MIENWLPIMEKERQAHVKLQGRGLFSVEVILKPPSGV